MNKFLRRLRACACAAQGPPSILAKLTKIANVRAPPRPVTAREFFWPDEPNRLEGGYDYWPEKTKKGTYVRQIIRYRERV